MRKPTIHLNGSSRESLLEGYHTAFKAVGQALEALNACTPHGRDYYPQAVPGDAVPIIVAQREHQARVARLAEVAKELHELALHCHNAGKRGPKASSLPCPEDI